MKLTKRYVIGVHVMFFEIEIFAEYIDGLINLLSDIENKENVILDFCFNTSEHIEIIDTDKISKQKLVSKFKENIDRLQQALEMPNLKYQIHDTKDGFYYHADYRRDLNYKFCKIVDYIMHGETDSFFPKEALHAIETLANYTDQQNIHRYAMCFADRKMWDDSWNATVHVDYENLIYKDGENHHLNKNQAKSQLSIEEMNEINSKIEDFDFRSINYPKIDGSCLVLSADLIKFGVNVPSCLIYNDDEGLSIMGQKLCGQNYLQFVCKNLLKVHARRHPQKRLYVKDEDNSHAFAGGKNSNFQKFKQLSQHNISVLINGKGKFYEYKDYKI